MRNVISTLRQLRDGSHGHRWSAALIYPTGIQKQAKWLEAVLRAARLYPANEMDAHRAHLTAYVRSKDEAGGAALKLLNENEHLRAQLALRTGNEDLLGYFSPRHEYDKACRERDLFKRQRDSGWRALEKMCQDWSTKSLGPKPAKPKGPAE